MTGKNTLALLLNCLLNASSDKIATLNVKTKLPYCLQKSPISQYGLEVHSLSTSLNQPHSLRKESNTRYLNCNPFSTHNVSPLHPFSLTLTLHLLNPFIYLLDDSAVRYVCLRYFKMGLSDSVT